MTNAEKYLKDEVDLEEFSKSIMTWYFGNYAKANDFARIKNWAEHKIETLTEDERVILRNIDKTYTHISRTYGDIWVGIGEETADSECKRVCVFNHLFQFIKERRRILNRRIIRRAKMTKKRKDEIAEKIKQLEKELSGMPTGFYTGVNGKVIRV